MIFSDVEEYVISRFGPPSVIPLFITVYGVAMTLIEFSVVVT